MFEIHRTIKFLTLISYIGFIISCISGFIVISDKFNICIMMTSFIVLVNTMVFIALDITNQFEEYINKITYMRAYILIIFSLLVIGISPVGVAFGIYGMIMGFINIFVGIFCIEETVPIVTNDNT